MLRTYIRLKIKTNGNYEYKIAQNKAMKISNMTSSKCSVPSSFPHTNVLSDFRLLWSHEGWVLS